MKIKHFLLIFLLSFAFLFQTSCSSSKKVADKAKTHKQGWTKNPNNPHHPNTTNPGHNKHNDKKNNDKKNNDKKQNGKGKKKG